MRDRLAPQVAALRTRRLRVSLRGLIKLVALSGLLLAYIGSYHRLSRRGMREAPEYGISGFLYVPVAEAAASEDLSRHHALAIFYAPLNWIDRAAFGAPGPCDCIMWRLSG
jgi:hypothetical protein